MANAKEIQVRMHSIQDTMKITNAMYLISSSKLKKAKQILANTEPYFYSVQSTIGRILRHVPDLEHIYFDARSEVPAEERKIGYIVVTADKGLAGGYNHDILKLAEAALGQPGVHKFYVLGVIGRQYFASKHIAVEGTFRYTVQNPTINRARRIAGDMIKAYYQHELDEIHLIYTEMVNPMKSEAKSIQLLPLKKVTFGQNGTIPADVHHEEVILEPSGAGLMDSIVPNYLVGIIYSCLVESYASEQNARMMAMKSSTDSASEMLKNLQIQYNRARQAAITQEITEVISGARAQRGSEHDE